VSQANRLHDPEDRRYVVCDEVLQEAFGCTRFAASDLTRLVSEHLSPADPIEIEYTIKYHLPYLFIYLFFTSILALLV
jgi:chromatin remodeling complex protein RSC6